MKRILVTGAAGFVGRHVLAELSAGATPSIRILGIGRGNPETLPEHVAYESVDLLDEAALRACIAEFQPTTTLHLAAMASVQQLADSPIETWRSNIVSLLNLANSLTCNSPGSTLIFVSSGEVYGRSFQSGKALCENDAPLPVGNYARSKWIGEEILRGVIPRAGIKLIILRPFNHIGPGQDDRFVVPSFAAQIARIEAGLSQPVLEVGNLDAVRDFLPIGDVVRAYAQLIANAERIESGTIFNVASGVARSIDSVLSDLRALAYTPFKVSVASDRVRPSEIQVALGDATLLKSVISWKPAADWTTTLAEILAAARTRVENFR